MKCSDLVFYVKSARQELDIKFYMDGVLVGQCLPDDNWQEVKIQLPQQDGNHCFEVEMQGKTPQHTKIDADGNILEDLLIEFKDWRFDDIELGHAASELIVYEHDHNGTSDVVQQRFFGQMGCNGKIKLQFESPVFNWLLLHLL